MDSRRPRLHRRDRRHRRRAAGSLADAPAPSRFGHRRCAGRAMVAVNAGRRRRRRAEPGGRGAGGASLGGCSVLGHRWLRGACRSRRPAATARQRAADGGGRHGPVRRHRRPRIVRLFRRAVDRPRVLLPATPCSPQPSAATLHWSLDRSARRSPSASHWASPRQENRICRGRCSPASTCFRRYRRLRCLGF